MKGTVCQLNYYGGGCLRSVHPGPDGSNCEAAWPFATAPLGLKVGDAVTFTLTEGGQAVDLQVATEPKKDPEPTAMTSSRTDGEAAAPKGIEPTIAQRKLQRNMSRFHNANLEEQLEMLQRAEERLNAAKLAGDEIDGTSLCKLVNQLSAFLHAPGETIAVASGDGDASAVAGSRNAGLQQKVRKLLIGCLELLDLTDGTTHELVDTALQHIRDLVMVKTLSQNQPSDGDASSSLKRKHKVAEDQWQALAALVGTHPDDASALVRADAVPGEAAKRKVLKGKDRASSAGGHYQPSSKVKKLDSVKENTLDVVTLKCSECHQTVTSSWFWEHPTKKNLCVLTPAKGHVACKTKTGKRCPWRPVDGRLHKDDIFSNVDFCEHGRMRTQCAACGGSKICEHQKLNFNCKICKGQRRGSRSGKGPAIESRRLVMFHNDKVGQNYRSDESDDVIPKSMSLLAQTQA